MSKATTSTILLLLLFASLSHAAKVSIIKFEEDRIIRKSKWRREEEVKDIFEWWMKKHGKTYSSNGLLMNTTRVIIVIGWVWTSLLIWVMRSTGPFIWAPGRMLNVGLQSLKMARSATVMLSRLVRMACCLNLWIGGRGVLSLLLKIKEAAVIFFPFHISHVKSQVTLSHKS